MLGAEPLYLLVAAAHVGDATGMCSQGQWSCAALPVSGVGNGFCLSWHWQEKSHIRDAFLLQEGASCSFGRDVAQINLPEANYPSWP